MPQPLFCPFTSNPAPPPSTLSHPCIPIPLPHPPSSAALSFISFLCAVRCREEESYRGRDGGKERDLLLAFRWFHMKSQSTHLDCRHWRPTASRLLPPSIPEVAFNCLCIVQACTKADTGTRFASMCNYRHWHTSMHKHTRLSTSVV